MIYSYLFDVLHEVNTWYLAYIVYSEPQTEMQGVKYDHNEIIHYLGWYIADSKGIHFISSFHSASEIDLILLQSQIYININSRINLMHLKKLVIYSMKLILS